MALFFFHFHDGHKLDEDQLGIELPSAERALAEAVDGAVAMWPELLAARTDPRQCRFHIANAQGAELFVLPLAELLENCLAEPIHVKGSGAMLHQDLHETHRRAQLARRDVTLRLAEVRQSLDVSRSLLQRLNKIGNSAVSR